MGKKSEIYYQTNILKPNIKIIALSDIHGDIQSLIICLRDCGEVIKKKSSFDKNSYDLDMETELNKDLNDPKLNYAVDLGYKWIGSDTHVVICGDMIDPNRTKLCKKSNGEDCTFYPQIELKILLFINELNSQAIKYGGRIIKLMGNHELVNTISGENSNFFISRYSFSNERDNYFKGITRTNIFNVGQYGFKLLFEGGCGILVKINNYIFVHGDLGSKSFNYFDKINNWINNPENQLLSKFNQSKWNDKIEKTKLNNYMENSPLWNRKFGDPSKMSNRINNKIKENNEINENNENNKIKKNFCSDLVELFKIFKDDGINIKENPSELILIIGHCVQSDLSTQQNKISYSGNIYSHGQTYNLVDKQKSNSQIDVFNTNIYTGPSVFDRNDKSRIFGISMECGCDNLNDKCDDKQNVKPKLYRIDVGTSRGFDYFTGVDNKIKTPEDELKFIYSKTPQILMFDSDNSVHIIKSKIKNTRIHLPRHVYEYNISNNNEFDIHNSTNEHYKSKYFKYKQKYMKIKKNNT